MKLLCVLGLLSLYVALILAQNDTNTTDGPTTAAAPVTTAAPNTTTLSPNTTTVAPVTNATTVAPTTATTPSPAEVGNLYYLEKDGDICILLSVDMAFNFSYDKNDNTKPSIEYALPSNASVTIDGSCSPTDQYITLTWTPGAPGTNFTARLNFFEDSSKQQYVNNIILNYVVNDALFPGANITGPMAVNKTGTFFQVSENNQYLCKSNLTTEISADVKMLTYDMNLQAFRSDNTTEFSGTRQQCPEDAETNNIVPIAVGAALAALVVIVLIAYLISRNRNKGGYESV